MKGCASAVETEQPIRCLKYILPDGTYLDVLTDVLDEIDKWLQFDKESMEAGGYIVGYQHAETSNVSLERVSRPYIGDYRNRIHFTMRDPRHKLFLLNEQRKKSYYMGVWHTHPEDVPHPSETDMIDWRQSVENEKSGCSYIFFIIAGRKKIRIWAGSLASGTIEELKECKITEDGLYMI